jgi:lysozyme
MEDLVPHESCVDSAIPGLDIDKFSALVSFSFNIGCNALKTSTLAKEAKAKNYKAAAEEFGKWVCLLLIRPLIVSNL